MDQAVDLKSHMQQLMASSKIPAAEKKQTQRSVRGIPGSGKGSGRCRSRNKCGSSSRNSRAAALRTGSQTRRGKGLRWQGSRRTGFFRTGSSGYGLSRSHPFWMQFSGGPTAHGRTSARPCWTRPDFSEARCESSIFNQVVATGASFQSANLRLAVLTEADFSECDFSSAKLREADLSQSLLQKARMWNVTATKAAAAQTDFTDADLTGSDWSDSLLESRRFNRRQNRFRPVCQGQGTGSPLFRRHWRNGPL